MKNCFKRMGTLILAIAMVVSLVQPVKVQAASTEKMTMYAGEALEYYLYGTTIKSVSSSNSKVLKVAKIKDTKYACSLTAKKAGTATIKIKYKSGSSTGTKTLKITVKKLDIQFTAQTIDSGYVLVKIKNNTSQVFEKLQYTYTFKDADGNVVISDTETAYNVTAKNLSFDSIYAGYNVSVKASASKFKITGVYHNPKYTYKNASDKQVVAKVTSEEEDGSSLKLNITTNNKTGKTVEGYNYIISYDENDKIIDISTSSIYLSAKAAKTSTAYVSTSEYSHPTYDHYKIITRAYYYTK